MSEAPPEWGRDYSRGVLLLLSAEGLKKDLGPPKACLKGPRTLLLWRAWGLRGVWFSLRPSQIRWRCKQLSKYFEHFWFFSEIIFEMFRKVSTIFKIKFFDFFFRKLFENSVENENFRKFAKIVFDNFRKFSKTVFFNPRLESSDFKMTQQIVAIGPDRWGALPRLGPLPSSLAASVCYSFEAAAAAAAIALRRTHTQTQRERERERHRDREREREF